MDPQTKAKLLRVGTIAAGFVVVDQVTKYIAVHNFPEFPRPGLKVIPGLFDVVYVRNPGAAFGSFRGLPDNLRVPFFIAVSLIAVGVVGYLAWKADHRERWGLLGMGMVMGGAIGNLIDRIHHGFVVDFMDFYIKDSHYWTFNVADIGITGGVALLIVSSYLWERKQKQGKKQKD